MVLPPPTLPTSRQSFQPPSSSDSSLFHPSTFIHSAPIDSPHTATPNSILSPGGQSVSSQGHSFGGESWEGITGMTSPGYPGLNDPMGLGLVATTTTPSYSGVQHDAFQAMVAGELPPDRTLIGEGQKLTSQVIDLFLKVDAKLKVSVLPHPIIHHTPKVLFTDRLTFLCRNTFPRYFAKAIHSLDVYWTMNWRYSHHH